MCLDCFVASSSGSRVPFASAFALRQRMISFVQNYELYMMFEGREKERKKRRKNTYREKKNKVRECFVSEYLCTCCI